MTQKHYHNGINKHRLGENSLELAFAFVWQEINEQRDLLECLLHTGGSGFPKELTDRDREVAATIIQWLGSPVGQDFLREVEERRRLCP